MEQEIKVFVIDDDLDDQVLMKQAFESAEIPTQIKFATRSDDALKYLAGCTPDTRPDIIISDYNMPLMNGEEFLKKLVAEKTYQATPKVIVSTAASPAIIDACMAHGASRYLIKPSDFEELVSLAKTILALVTPKQ